MSSKLAEHLRALPDDGLAAFLRLRPDLVVPVPTDISALAARAQSRVSVVRALDTLDQFTLEVLYGLRLGRDDDGNASVERLLTLTAEAGGPPAQGRAARGRTERRHRGAPRRRGRPAAHPTERPARGTRGAGPAVRRAPGRHC